MVNPDGGNLVTELVTPGSRAYNFAKRVGFGPLTAPEAVAICNFTLQHIFSLMITYRIQGRVI